MKTNAELEQWIDTQQVLYAEGLLPKWQQEELESTPGFKWDASHIAPAFRAIVVREHLERKASANALPKTSA